MSIAKETIEYLRQQSLMITTAESCTAGEIVMLLSEVPGSGKLIECGYVVYSPQAKQRLLHVSPATMETFNLTSVEVASEMAIGALRDSTANVAVATTGILGPDDMDGIKAGTVCFAWAFQFDQRHFLFSTQQWFPGSRSEVQTRASEFALQQLPDFHRRALRGEGGWRQ
ncbi:ompetence-damaged protein [Pseudomonas sp. Choline-02u-1]|jgi:nicotinamide-nucleotide amidase|uniref:CinA family protein n=1 Tax=unclassified Pseudomonas TaxID=196821 RepID=UPI000C3414CF|nr:CinA family protein [Pseudomonas sp. Choline-02u-1]PKH84977.1 ompetence-damaged protein [Pseudomonas sp. Choline-02u-1]